MNFTVSTEKTVETSDIDSNEPQAFKRILEHTEDDQIISKNSAPSKMLKCNPESSQKIEFQEGSLIKGTKDATNQSEPSKIGNQTCSYYVLRKKRYCKMLVAKGRKFCGQHLTEDTENESVHKRIPCPLDPKHTCFENKLSSHMKICNARERMDKPFFVKRINEGENEDDDGDESCSSSSPLKDLTDEELMEYIRKIEKIYDENIVTIELRIKDHPAVGDALSKPGIGHSVIRHLKQNSSLLSLLEDKDLINGGKDRVFVEFGAGRGKLTGWVIEAVKKKEEPLFILIDKGSQRYKIDAKLKYEDNLRIKRLRVDIQDLDLSRVEGIEENSEIVVCGKHLCGAATDFSLRCISNCGKGSTCGIVIALCCHHRCTWKAYVGKKFLKEVGFSGKDFPVLVSLSSWAVSGSRQSLVNKEQLELSDEEEEISSIPEPNINENRYERMGLSIDYRESIGRKVKAIIDHGRVEYVNNKHNLRSKLVQYVEQTSTLENIALVAYGNTL